MDRQCCQTIRHSFSVWSLQLSEKPGFDSFHSGRLPLSALQLQIKRYERLLTEKQICKLDLCAWHNWLIGGLHGWVWWEQPGRIIDLWWFSFSFSFLNNCKLVKIYILLECVSRVQVFMGDLRKICCKNRHSPPKKMLAFPAPGRTTWHTSNLSEIRLVSV